MGGVRFSRSFSSFDADRDNNNNTERERTSFSNDGVPRTPIARTEPEGSWRVTPTLPAPGEPASHRDCSPRMNSPRLTMKNAPPVLPSGSRVDSPARSQRFTKTAALPHLPEGRKSMVITKATSYLANPEEEKPIAPEDFKPDWRFRVAYFSLMVINLAAALDATSLSVALPIIAQELNGRAIEAFWAGTSFLLASTVVQPILASFSHIFGRKPVLLISLTVFAIGAIVCALSKNFTHMLVGRSIQGIGAGGIIVLTDIIVTDFVPLRKRGKWFGLVSMMWAIGSVTGPVIGGAFAERASWTWIFWINLPFIGIGAVLVPPFLKLDGRQENLMDKVKRVDYIGSIIFVGSVTSFLIPISWGGIQYPWNSWRTITPLAVGAAGMILFLAYENLLADEKTIPLHIFRNLSTSIAFAGTFLHGVMLWSVLYYLPLYFEAVKGYTPIIAGVACFPETFTVAPCTVVVAIIVQLTGRYRWALWSGWVIATAGMGLMYLLDVDTPVWQWILINLVPGVGLGLLLSSMGFSIQASAPQKDAAGAVAMFTFFRGLGQSVGVAIGGVIFQNRIKASLQAFPDIAPKAGLYAQDASALVEIIKSLLNGSPMKAELQVGYAEALKWIWIVMCGFSGVAMMASFFVKAYTLDLALETEQGWKNQEKPNAERENGGELRV
ncbi:hypothetical protein PV11_04327 [Exophiala sideris]|uniref:Major facilitator superfamily (MFS) profile domain-containing protein n=1 Tax=Exophiala sideris TaxID=1016849 RepID=A0A0D1W0E9_9EURO|nr:hypothetical protein PV11_04327 [Exophiala sideris]